MVTVEFELEELMLGTNIVKCNLSVFLAFPWIHTIFYIWKAQKLIRHVTFYKVFISSAYAKSTIVQNFLFIKK